MMKIGASSFIWVSPFSNETLDLIGKVKAMGFDLIEICIEDPATIDTKRIKDELNRQQIEVTVCGAFGPHRDSSSRDQSVRQQAASYLRFCIDAAADLGAGVVAGPMYSAVGKTELLSEEERRRQRDRAVATLKPVAEYAGSKGIRLAIEPLNRFETDLINTVEQGLDLIEQIGSPQVGFLLDTFHMNIEERDPAKAIETASGRVFHFHACENDRGTPGKGSVPWEKVATALGKIQYQGPVVIEAFNTGIKEIARAVCLWRPLARDQDTLAREGLQFLRGLFRD